MKKHLALLLPAATISLLTGCAAFKHNDLPNIETNQLAINSATNKTKVFCQWSLETDFPYADSVMKNSAASMHKGLFEHALAESGCCELVGFENQADVVVKGTSFSRRNSVAEFALTMSAATLYIFPAWVNGFMDIKVIVSSGGKNIAYELKDGMTLVTWIPMIFALPFTGLPNTAAMEVDQNVYRNLILRMKNDNLLQTNNARIVSR